MIRHHISEDTAIPNLGQTKWTHNVIEEMSSGIPNEGQLSRLANREERDENACDSSEPALRRKKTKVTGKARPPPRAFRVYKTEYYQLYDHLNPHPVEPVKGPFTSFKAYDEYTLFIRAHLPSIEEIPTSGVRIDDLTISRVISKMKASQLHKNWPADLDRHGMVRATRMPLGLAAKVWVDIGDVDVHGQVIPAGEEGWYYKWWGGIHCLMGKEGFDVGMYLIRPSHEEFLVKGFGFKKGCRAVVQAGEGVDVVDLEA